MIIEGLVTTLDPTGALHIAPMGPAVTPDFGSFVLRPFPTAQTYQNLCAHPEGVLHVTDDVLLLALAALGRVRDVPPHRSAEIVRGFVLVEACRAYEFRVVRADASAPRMHLDCEVVHTVRIRDFFGFNRAKHAVIEAAILATRVHLLPLHEIEAEFAKFEVLIRKTGGPRETAAFAVLQTYLGDVRKERV